MNGELRANQRVNGCMNSNAANPGARHAVEPARRRMASLALVMLVFSCTGNPDLWAAPKTPDTAIQVVKGWLRADPRPLENGMGQGIVQVQTFCGVDGQALFHVVGLEPAGFVIVAADDSVEPIIGFAEEGVYDPCQTCPLAALVNNDLAGRVQSATEPQGSPHTMKDLRFSTSPTQEKWLMLEQLAEGPDGNPPAKGISAVSDVRISPLSKTRWDQGSICSGSRPCYNYYTPNQYPSGCLATALAQLMYYHQYPQYGVGTGSFAVRVDGNGRTLSLRGGNGSGGTYRWDLMPLACDCLTTETQRQAIGALCYDAGVACHTEYGSQGSSSMVPYAKTAIVNTFGYGNAIDSSNCGLLSCSNIGAGLTNMINPNLDAALPVLLGVIGTGGHGVVVDGYGYNFGTMYHHLNIGASGLFDVWYNLPRVDVTSEHTYTTVVDCLYNVFPSGSGEIISGRVTDRDGWPIGGAAVTGDGPGGPYTDVTDDRGIYALAKVRSMSTYVVTAAKPGVVFEAQTVSTGISVDDSPTSGNRWGIDFQQTDTYLTGSGGGDEYISGVTIGVVENVGTGASGYGDYTSIAVGVVRGSNYPVTIINGKPYSSDQCGLWVDWNLDGDFDDLDEAIAVAGSPGKGPYTATLQVPWGTAEGNLRMRVRITYTGSLTPHGNTPYGEVEDYTIIVRNG